MRLAETCAICSSSTWCGRPCIHAPKRTVTEKLVTKLPDVTKIGDVTKLPGVTKRGRPTKGEKAASVAERVRRYRESRKGRADSEKPAGAVSASEATMVAKEPNANPGAC